MTKTIEPFSLPERHPFENEIQVCLQRLRRLALSHVGVQGLDRLQVLLEVAVEHLGHQGLIKGGRFHLQEVEEMGFQRQEKFVNWDHLKELSFPLIPERRDKNFGRDRNGPVAFTDFRVLDTQI